MITDTALHISEKLSMLWVEKVIGSGTAYNIRASEIRNHIPKKFDTEYKKIILSRTVELLSLTLDVPYETETLLLILLMDGFSVYSLIVSDSKAGIICLTTSETTAVAVLAIISSRLLSFPYEPFFLSSGRTSSNTQRSNFSAAGSFERIISGTNHLQE